MTVIFEFLVSCKISTIIQEQLSGKVCVGCVLITKAAEEPETSCWARLSSLWLVGEESLGGGPHGPLGPFAQWSLRNDASKPSPH